MKLKKKQKKRENFEYLQKNDYVEIAMNLMILLNVKTNSTDDFK